MMAGFFRNFACLLNRHRTLTLALFLGMTLVLSLFTLRSQVDNSLEVWQSADDVHWLQYQEFGRRYEITDPLIVYLPGTDLFVMEDVEEALSAEVNAGAIHAMVVEEGTEKEKGLFFVMPRTDMGPMELDGLLADVEEVLGRFDTSYSLGGVWYLTAMLDSLSAQATQTLFPVVLLILALGVWYFIRDLNNVLLVLACGFLPALQITGVMALVGVRLNMVLLALPPLTMILGIAHAIHLVAKVPDDEHQTSIDLFTLVAPPCLLSGITTTFGFLSLTLSSYLPVRQLGIWGMVASLLALLSAFILMAVFFKAGGRKPVSIAATMAVSLNRFRYGLLTIFLLCTLIACFGLARLSTGSLILDFFNDDDVVRQNYQAIEGAGLGLTPFEVDLASSRLSNVELQKIMANYGEKHPVITHIFYYFESGEVVTTTTATGLQLPRILTLEGMAARPERATFLMKTLASEPTLALAEDLEEYLQKNLGNQPQPYVTGSVPLYTRGQKALFSSLMNSFAFAFLSISVIMGLSLRSLRYGLLAIIPNFLPVFFIIAAMGWLVIPLSVATVTVASIVFGIVVDDSIHFLHRLRSEEVGLDLTRRLQNALDHVGPAIITTTLVAGTGFLGFLASPFIPLRNFGLLISGALALALICDLFLLPVLLLVGKKER
ncbi:MAG: hypothetical protein KKD73_06195 [Proteobacteria bacterium]|nr:hypothetical protein [Pseudomonadota bacterium]MBU1640665.1 hypothetical protein [Pseudomonadota bacterium]